MVLVSAGIIYSFKKFSFMSGNGVAARMVYENAMDTLLQVFGGDSSKLAQVRPCQSYLRTELALTTTDNVYNFNLLVNENNPAPFNTEKRLALQNSFVASEMGIFVASPASTADTNFPLLTYPNTQEFGTPAAMFGLYNGALNITINNVRYMDGWDLWRHYYRPQTQQTAALGAGSPGDQNDGSIDGWYPLEPNVVFVGSKDNRIQITLPVALTAIDANSRVILMFRGILAQNSTSVQ